MVSIIRRSARQAEPAAGSRLETVPEPMTVPASSSRVRAAWAISVGKSKFMSTPALGLPNSLPLRELISGRITLRPSQADPSSSGVTATGENAVAGLPWTKPKPLASSTGIRLRRLTSLTSITSLMWPAASTGETPMGTSSVTTATSLSKSIPPASSPARILSVGPMKLSEPP